MRDFFAKLFPSLHHLREVQGDKDSDKENESDIIAVVADMWKARDPDLKLVLCSQTRYYGTSEFEIGCWITGTGSAAEVDRYLDVYWARTGFRRNSSALGTRRTA